MSDNLPISNEEIIKYLKISCQFSTIIEEVIMQKIVAETAKKLSLAISDRDLQEAADHFRLTNNLITATDTMKWLTTNHLNLEEFEAKIYHDLLNSKLQQHLFSDQVEAYFYQHQIDYQQAIIYEIALDSFDLALELFFSIQEGEVSFWELAHQYIQDEELRRCGGYRGILQRAAMKPDISAAVFTAKPPQILKPITIENKTYLIFVEAIINPQLDKQLRDEIIIQLYQEWLKQQHRLYN